MRDDVGIRFGEFLLDRSAGGLFRIDERGNRSSVALGSRALDVLGVLANRQGDVVSKHEIMEAAWPDTVVEENNLTVQISALRRAMGGHRDGSSIQTIPGRGYRLVTNSHQNGGNAGRIVEDRPDSEAMPAAPSPTPIVPARKWHPLSWVCGLAGLCLTAALVVVFVWPPNFRQTATGASPRLSIVVLPFKNLGNDPRDDYLADGVTDDLTSDLARLSGAFVIARQSAYSYRKQPRDVRRIGDELGVRYVLEGSIRRIDAMLRVNAQLVSSETGAHLWADRFDQPLNSLNAGQDTIVRRIGQSLNVTLTDIESSRSKRERPATPDAFDLIIRARSIRNGLRSPVRNEQALALFEQAQQLDSASTQAVLGIAGILIDRNFATLGQWMVAEDVARAATLVAMAQAVQPDAEDVLVAVAEVAQAQERWTDLALTAQRIIELYPNRVEGYELLGMAKRFVGTVEEAVQLYEQSIRLNPRESNLFHRCSCMGYALLLVGRYDESIIWFERSLTANPDASPASRGGRYRSIAAAHVLAGRPGAAREAMRKADQLSPYATARIFFPDNPQSAAQVTQMQRLVTALHEAGLPDHADENADYGLDADVALHRDLTGPTPTSTPGARTVRTEELASLLAVQKPIVIDTALYSWGRSVPGAISLRNAGIGGNLLDTAQTRLGRKMRELTKDELATPIVAVGFNVLRFDGRNLALRLIGLGYTNVYWYRGGREAWEVAGLPETDMKVEPW